MLFSTDGQNISTNCRSRHSNLCTAGHSKILPSKPHSLIPRYWEQTTVYQFHPINRFACPASPALLYWWCGLIAYSTLNVIIKLHTNERCCFECKLSLHSEASGLSRLAMHGFDLQHQNPLEHTRSVRNSLQEGIINSTVYHCTSMSWWKPWWFWIGSPLKHAMYCSASELQTGRKLLAATDDRFNFYTKSYPGRNVMVCKSCDGTNLQGATVAGAVDGNFKIFVIDSGIIIRSVISHFLQVDHKMHAGRDCSVILVIWPERPLACQLQSWLLKSQIKISLCVVWPSARFCSRPVLCTHVHLPYIHVLLRISCL